jgi:ABC-type Mn2+/Zn2+ transport system ATPase subunit
MTDLRHTALVEATDVALGYGRRRVLEQVDWCIRAGEYWFVLGPNGEGKSTLVRALLGLLPPQAGRLVRHAELADRSGVSFVPQRCELNPALPTTVREFVGQGFVGLSLPRGERERRLADALERVSLPGSARWSFWSLSGGQRQRALLARALVREPRLLVLDEPASGLDVTSEELLMQTLARLHDGGLTLVLVTHDLAMAARFATHVALVHGGRVQVGLRAEVLTGPRLSAAYEVPLQASAASGGHLVVMGGGGGAP